MGKSGEGIFRGDFRVAAGWGRSRGLAVGVGAWVRLVFVGRGGSVGMSCSSAVDVTDGDGLEEGEADSKGNTTSGGTSWASAPGMPTMPATVAHTITNAAQSAGIQLPPFIPAGISDPSSPAPGLRFTAYPFGDP